MSIFNVEYYPKKGELTTLKSIINFDPNAWYLPKAFYRLVAKEVARGFFKQIYKLSKNAHNEAWGERMRQNEEFYDWLRQIVFNYKAYYELKHKEEVEQEVEYE